MVAGDVHERFPLLVRRGIEHEVEIHVHETRHILGALDVTAHPINRIGDAAKHWKPVSAPESGWMPRRVWGDCRLRGRWDYQPAPKCPSCLRLATNSRPASLS